MTREQAIALGETRFWESMTPREIATFQLHEPLLCMPFDVYHGAMEKALGRPVWTHEFGSAGVEGLKAELRGDLPPPTMEEIIALVPADKRMVISTEA